MNTDMNTVRLLGAAQVMVFVGIMIMGGFLASAVLDPLDQQLDPAVYPISS